MSDSGINFDEPIHYKKGQVIFAEGEASTFLYIVAIGDVAIVKENKGRVTADAWATLPGRRVYRDESSYLVNPNHF